MSWEGAQSTQMQLDEIPQRARDTLQSATAGGKLNDQVTLLSKNGKQIFRATVNRAGEQDLYLFVQQDGTVVQTKQKVGFNEAPISVQNAIRQQLGGGQQPNDLYRVIEGDQTSFVASSGEGQQAKMIRVDNTGNVLDTSGGGGASQQGDRQGRTRIPQQNE